MNDAGAHDAPADLVELGRIAAAHGVRGQVKIQLHDAGSDTLYSHKTWWLQVATTSVVSIAVPPRPVRVLSCQRHHDALIAQIEGIHDRDHAQALKGATLHLSRACFPRTADDEYYWVDLIGCALYGTTADGQDVLLGSVVQVSDNGAHALLHVVKESPDGIRLPQQLIPFVAAHILRVCLPERRIDSNWPVDF